MTDSRRRHLSLVPDLPADPEPVKVEPAISVPTLVAVDGRSVKRVQGPESESVSLPPGTTAADLIRTLAKSGAPQPFLDHAATFGNDVDGLFAWLGDFGPVWSERQWAADLLDHWKPLLKPKTTALSAEAFGYEFLTMYDDDADSPDLLQHLISEVVKTRRRDAVALLRVLAFIGPATIRADANRAADRLVASGVAEVPWAADLSLGVWVSASGFVEPQRGEHTLTLEFRVGKKSFGFLLVTEVPSGSVIDCRFTANVSTLRAQAEIRASLLQLSYHDYPQVYADGVLTAALAATPRPRSAAEIANVSSFLPLLRARAHLVAPPDSVTPLNISSLPAAPATLADATYRIKVTIEDTKPPIWRRLEVSSSITLAELHQALQTAFGWTSSHLWVFETPTGEFGVRDQEMEYGDASGLRLSTAAPTVGAQLTYLYDFGDNWRHLITVEAIEAASEIPADAPTDGPTVRCLGGRRAGPPEDCGGVGGYERLIDVLADPTDPDHQHMVSWLGLKSADQFKPGAFSAAKVNKSFGRW